MKKPLYELTQNIDRDLLKDLSFEIKKIFPNNDCYFIGSVCIDGVYKSDIDFTVLLEGQLSKEEVRMFRALIMEVDQRLQCMFTFIDDQTDLKNTPYFSMQDFNDYNIVNRKDFSNSEFKEFKNQLNTHLWKKKRYYKDGMVSELSV